MGTGYQLLVTGHLLCVIGGFGYLAYSGLTLTVGRRRGAAIGTLEVSLQVGTLPEALIYGALLFGIAAVGTGRGLSFSQGWVSASLALYVVAVGVLHGVIRRSQRRYLALAQRIASSVDSAVGRLAAQGDEAALEAIERRLGLGWGAFNLVVVAVVALMVFQPGR